MIRTISAGAICDGQLDGGGIEMLDIHCQSPREVNPDDNQGLYSGGDSDEMMLITSTNVLITWNNFYKQRIVYVHWDLLIEIFSISSDHVGY